jgi:hypothetical protein
MVAKLIRLTYRIAIQLHLVAESCTICSSRSRQPSGNFWILPRECLKTGLDRNLKLTETSVGFRNYFIEYFVYFTSINVT